MATHDYVVSNGTGAAVRSDLNGALAAIVSQNSSASAPATMYAYMLWADTTAGIMKMRNGANSAWISLWELDGTFIATDISLSAGTAGAPSLYFTGDTNTGIYSPGADQVALTTGGTQRLAADTAAVTSTLPVVHPLGAVGTPSITFTGDLNTGLFSPAADTVALVTGGTNRLHITSTGLVGLGSSSPALRLHASIADATAYTTASDGNVLRLANTTAGGFSGISFTTEPSAGNAGIASINSFAPSGGDSVITFSTRQGSTLSERVRIAPDGKLGIGTSSNRNSTKLDVLGDITFGDNASYYGTLGYNAGTGHLEYTSSDGAFKWIRRSGTATSMVLDSSGRLLVGTSSALSTNTGALLQLYGTGGSEFVGSSANNNPAAGDPITMIRGLSQSGSSYGTCATIAIQSDATTSLNDYPGRIVFSTTADGAASPTERMRIQQNGYVWMGHSSVSVSPWDATSGTFAKFADIYPIGATSQSNIVAIFNRNTTTGTLIECKYNGNVVGNITVTASATAYNTSSDYRLKENVTAVTDGITRLQQLKPSRFNFIADPDTTVDGFIAHEAQAVVPECVTGTKDEVDTDGNPVYQGIDQSKLVPLLTAALQEAIGRIETLEAEVTALKGA